LVIQIARLILVAFAIADVAHQRLDAHPGAVRFEVGVRVDLDPQRGPVGPAQPQQVVGDGAFAREAIEEHGAGVLIGEAVRREGADLCFGRVRRVAEDEAQKRIGRERLVVVGCQTADVHTLVQGFEEARECLGAGLTGICRRGHDGIIP
jgi:hypothetical protein